MINFYSNNKKTNSQLLVKLDLDLIDDEYTSVLIKELYDFRYYNSGQPDLNILITLNKWKESRIFKIINHLETLKWIRCWNINRKYTLTGIGAEKAIQYNLISPNYAEYQENQRLKILSLLASQYEKTTRHSKYDEEDLALNLNENVDDLNVFIADLKDLGYINSSQLRLTEVGYQKFNNNIQWKKIIQEFGAIRELNPQKRGIEFEKVFAKVLNLSNWDVEHSVKNTNEENDIMISLNRENYLIELKWLKDPVEAHYIRNLITKLSNRTGMRGVFISMSGFTSGAITQVKEQSNNQLVYLYGPKDIESIFNESKTFDYHLTQKHKSLQLKKELIWS